MKRVQETPVFTINQLPEKAFANAYNAWYQTAADHDWWDCTIEDMTTILSICGFNNAKVHFSLGYCQGDFGSINSGEFYYRNGWKKKLKDEYPHLFNCQYGKHLISFMDEITAICKHHFYSVYIDITNGKLNRMDCGNNAWDWSHENKINELLRDVGKYWIYQSLQSEYEYIVSKDLFISECESNDLLFSEDGKQCFNGWECI